MPQVAIGLIGYYQFVRGYPIGPELKERLEKLHRQDDDIVIMEMNWGPIAIVQDFQANPISYDRIVLIAAIDRGLDAGKVTCRHWIGGKLDVLAVQERVFEAVTGVISLDNLLVIGEHFGIWPEEVITVEVQLANSAFGDLVLSELEYNRHAGEVNIVGRNPLAPDMERIVKNAYEMASQAALYGIGGLSKVETLDASQLSPVADVCHNQLLRDCDVSDTASPTSH